MSDIAIEAHGWTWRHAGRRDPAVADLDLKINTGERVLIVGASGSGKSTLVHGIAGLLDPEEDGDESGQLLINGHPARAARGDVGLVLQDPASQVLMERLGDDVAFGCENLGLPRATIWERAHAALEQVGLPQPLKSPTYTLSGGQQQRMALAGVLAMRPTVIALDEPTANLDPEGALQVRDAIAALPRTHTLVIVEHRLPMWLPVVDRLIVFDHSTVVADGSPASVLQTTQDVLTRAGVWLPDFPVPDFAPANDQRRDRSSILEATALSVGYTGQSVHAPVNHQFAPSTCTAIIGPNGTGKSTLARTLAGLQPALNGTVHTAPELSARAARHWSQLRWTTPLTTNPAEWRSHDIPSRIGFVFQNPGHQFVAPSVAGELELAARFRAEADAPDNTDGLLDQLGLLSLKRANPHTLSGGEQRRLSVATALAAAPPILILDEPTFGQDANTWRTLVEAFAGLRDSGHTIVLVTHDGALLKALAPNLIEMGVLQ